MTLLREIVGSKARRRRAAFIPYITAGDPFLAGTGRFVRALARAGADVVELGVPFSDPIADGPVNQRAAERALASGTTLASILERSRGWFSAPASPAPVLFTYLNPLLRMGLRTFTRRAKAAGIRGVLTVDLPPEEAGEYRRALAAAGLETVFLASPTTSPARLKAVAAAATGFVYYVSRLGVTGTSATVSRTLEAEVRRVRRAVGKPIAVGFGISTAEQAGEVGRFADGVVVGSALVRLIERNPPKTAEKKIERLAGQMVAALEGNFEFMSNDSPGA